MEPTTLIGYAGAIIIGGSLGLMGGGGSILTVPFLVYLLGVSPVLATAYSLFIVGITSLIGAVECGWRGLLKIKTGIIFSIPAFISVYLTRKFLIPAIPENIASIGNLEITKDMSIMVFFALIMLVSSWSMIRSGKKSKKLEDKKEKPASTKYPLIFLEGLLVGVVTGIVGAGGGFLIVPALVLLAGMEMKLAVGTSLMIISAKSLIGFLGDVAEQEINWTFLLIFSGISVIGIFGGSYLRRYISGQKLKKGFGWFVLIMAIGIIIKETII